MRKKQPRLEGSSTGPSPERRVGLYQLKAPCGKGKTWITWISWALTFLKPVARHELGEPTFFSFYESWLCQNYPITDPTCLHMENKVLATVQVITGLKYAVQNTRFPQARLPLPLAGCLSLRSPSFILSSIIVLLGHKPLKSSVFLSLSVLLVQCVAETQREREGTW